MCVHGALFAAFVSGSFCERLQTNRFGGRCRSTAVVEGTKATTWQSTGKQTGTRSSGVQHKTLSTRAVEMPWNCILGRWMKQFNIFHIFYCDCCCHCLPASAAAPAPAQVKPTISFLIYEKFIGLSRHVCSAVLVKKQTLCAQHWSSRFTCLCTRLCHCDGLKSKLKEAHTLWLDIDVTWCLTIQNVNIWKAGTSFTPRHTIPPDVYKIINSNFLRDNKQDLDGVLVRCDVAWRGAVGSAIVRRRSAKSETC